ncbi:MAG: hypothetical protein GKC10_09655 [Methanosarcinales archaeon]|nr:hypothetical protein [Methanosarcinales archaeon]
MLMDMGGAGIPYQSQGYCNQMWILDLCGRSRLQDMSLPFASWARMQFVPRDRGYIMLFHRLPSGDLQTRYLGMAYPGHCYSSWFYASAMGSHELWYRIGWQESSRVRFHVWC